MQKEEIIAIAVKVSEGTATREEMALYVRHIDSFIRKYPDWENLSPGIRKTIGNQMNDHIRNKIQGKDKTPVPVQRLWPRMAGIAVAVILILFGIRLFYFSQKEVPGNITLLNNRDIAPGKQGATLILANGKKIILSDAHNGELAEEQGVVITKNEDGQIVYENRNPTAKNNQLNLLATAKGETYSVRLPDGSFVWLNAASSLKYPASFAAFKKRQVELTGEAYFEISKDKAHPFVVKTDQQEVEVLGTHFNINSYHDEPVVKTTLLEGSIRIRTNPVSSGKEKVPGENEQNRVLIPGQQANLLRSGDIKITAADPDVIAWKDGKFRFNNTSLYDVLRQLSRWYDVDIKYIGQIPDDRFTGGMDRNINASEALEILKYMKVNFKIEGRTIIVTK